MHRITLFTLTCLLLLAPRFAYPHKIFILMSYQENDSCGNPQYRGVIDALRYEGYSGLHIKSYYLNAKTTSKHEVKALQKKALEAFHLFRPDLTISIDDLAFQTLAPFFLDPKGKGYLVFTGTNISPEEYNRKYHFHRARRPTARITGVYEKLFIKEQLKFLTLIFGKELGEIPILYSSDPIGTIVLRQIMGEVAETPYEKVLVPMEVETLGDVKIAAKKIQGNPKVKAYIPVTISIKFDNISGKRFPIQFVAPVLLKRIKKPDLTINSTFVNMGFWGGVSVDFYQMGYSAGQMAAMLLRGYRIDSIKIKDAPSSIVVINLKRNRELGLRLPPSILGIVDAFVE